MLAYISGTNKPVNKYICCEEIGTSRYGSLEHAGLRRRNEGTERKSNTGGGATHKAGEGPKEIVT